MVSVGTVHLVATVFMAGVVVFVQVVHYPLMARVGPAEFAVYEAEHAARTGRVVIPAMLIELGAALWLAARPAGAAHASLPWVGLVLLLIVWLSTFLLQVPAHARLTAGFDEAAHRRLVGTNWIRTAAWLMRVPVAVLLAP